MAFSSPQSGANMRMKAYKVGPKTAAATAHSAWKQSLLDRCQQRVRENRLAILQSLRSRPGSPRHMLEEILADETAVREQLQSPSETFARSLQHGLSTPPSDEEVYALDLDLTDDERLDLLCALEHALYDDTSELAEQLQQEEDDEISQLAEAYENYSTSGMNAADGMQQAQLEADEIEAALRAYEGGVHHDSSASHVCRTPMGTSGRVYGRTPAQTAGGGTQASAGKSTQQEQQTLGPTDVRCPLCHSAQLYEDRLGSIVACPSPTCALHMGIATGVTQKVPSPPSSSSAAHRIQQGWQGLYSQRIQGHAGVCSGSVLYQVQKRQRGLWHEGHEGRDEPEAQGGKAALYMHCLDCGLDSVLIG